MIMMVVWRKDADLKANRQIFYPTLNTKGVLCQHYSHPEGKGLFSCVLSTFLSRPGGKCCQVQPVKPLMNKLNRGIECVE